MMDPEQDVDHGDREDWAESSATPVVLQADDLSAVEVRVAEPGPLIAALRSMHDCTSQVDACKRSADVGSLPLATAG
jgi:hypothetical protein